MKEGCGVSGLAGLIERSSRLPEAVDYNALHHEKDGKVAPAKSNPRPWVVQTGQAGALSLNHSRGRAAELQSFHTLLGELEIAHGSGEIFLSLLTHQQLPNQAGHRPARLKSRCVHKTGQNKLLEISTNQKFLVEMEAQGTLPCKSDLDAYIVHLE
jgi:hypothetical protein